MIGRRGVLAAGAVTLVLPRLGVASLARLAVGLDRFAESWNLKLAPSLGLFHCQCHQLGQIGSRYLLFEPSH